MICLEHRRKASLAVDVVSDAAMPSGACARWSMGVAPSELAVIVTGGARGLGRAMTLGLAKAGVRVAGADLPSSPAGVPAPIDLPRAQQPQERLHPIECNATRWEGCSAAVPTPLERLCAGHCLG